MLRRPEPKRSGRGGDRGDVRPGRRCRGRVQTALHLREEVGRTADQVRAHHQAVVTQHQHVHRPLAQPRGDRARERQAGVAVGNEAPGEPAQALRQPLLSVLADCERDRAHRVGVDHDRAGQERVQRGLDRGPQQLRVQPGDDGRPDRVGQVGRDRVEHRPQSDRDEDVAVQGIGEPQARRLDPEHAVELDGCVAAGRLHLLGIAAEGGREVGQLAERWGPRGQRRALRSPPAPLRRSRAAGRGSRP